MLKRKLHRDAIDKEKMVMIITLLYSSLVLVSEGFGLSAIS